MRKVAKITRPVSVFMAVLLLMVAVPWQAALAAMIGTETLMAADRAQQARAYVNRLVAHERVQQALISQGIDPLEARARVDSLTDSEIVRLADRIEQSPAGGDALVILVGASLFVFIVLLITDILGYTHVFPFVS